MNNVLENYQFNEFTLEVIEQEGVAWFIARPLAEFLGYQNPARDLRTNVDDVDIQNMYIPIKSNNYLCVNESGLYSLLIRSKKPEAKSFKRWVTSEVLPSIRKHGYYVTDEAKAENPVFHPQPFQRIDSAILKQLRQMSPNLASAYLNECGVTDDYVKEKAGVSILPMEPETTAIKFYHDWIENGIDGVPVIPALSMEVYALYQVWCADGGIYAMDIGGFISNLVKKTEIKVKRKRYLDKKGHVQQRRVLFPGDRVDYSQFDLGESIMLFSECLDGYRKQM